MKDTSITVAYGDGVGPEIMESTLEIMKQAGAKLKIQTVAVGEELYKKGYSSGISSETWESIKNNKILLKGPITTPQGGGYKSLNVTMRKTLGLYANVRPCMSYYPFVQTKHPNMDIVIIRENEEDLYAGVEYRQTHNLQHAIKLISSVGSERIIRYAFEYAVKNNRKKVSCFSKDNIMKLTDGAFHRIFDKVKLEYPQIETDHYIIDIGTARVASRPEIFDVIVTLNLYGDIVSDVVAEISGSVGLAGSANIGPEYAMFEAIHGSAPLIAGQDTANPSGLLHAAIMMLIHIGQGSVAANIHNAWLKTLEDGIHTKDIYNEATSTKKVGTKEFTKAVVERLGQKPSKMKAISYPDTPGELNKNIVSFSDIDKSEKKQLVGIDVYFDWFEGDSVKLAEQLNSIVDGELQLQMVSCRGLKVWPVEEDSLNTGGGDHWRTRFVPNNTEKKTSHNSIIYLLDKLAKAGFDFVKTENLYSFDDKVGFTLGQGE
ncbi:MAG: NADP-dependent isocitrate dehydrogenase [Alphaproteobacteria bacterium]